MGGARGSLIEALDDAEAGFFAGRYRELAELRAAVGRSWRRPVVCYLHGPEGVGKSALLRAFLRSLRTEGIPAALVEPRSLQPGAAGLLRAVGEGPAPGAGPPTWASAAAAVDGLAGGRGLALILDDYDRLGPLDRELREDFFPRLGPGVCLVLSGRLSPEALWRQDPLWRSAVREIRLDGLDEEGVAEFLRRRDRLFPWAVAPASALTAGRPLHLSLVADVLAQHGAGYGHGAGGRGGGGAGPAGAGPAAGADEAMIVRFALHALECILHPATNRQAWRAGEGPSAVDRALAAASLLRSFDRADLVAMLGRATVDPAWPRLTALPFVRRQGAVCVLDDWVRRLLSGAVARRRPWAEWNLRRRALLWKLSPSDDRPAGQAAPSWPEVAHLAREAPWHARLHPAVEAERGWRLARDACPEDLPAVLASRQALRGWLGLGADSGASVAAASLRSLFEADPQGFVVARDRGGHVLGFMAAAPLRPDTAAALRGHPLLTDDLPRLAWEAAAAGRERLLLWGVGALEHPADLCGALLRETCGRFGGHDGVLAVLPASLSRGLGLDETLPALGFAPGPLPAPASGSPADGQLRTWALDFGPEGYAAWLRRAVEPSLGARRPSDAGAAVRDALAALHDPDRLARTAVAGYLAERFGVRKAGAVRAWLLDALREADLGSPPLPGGELLTLYYVERVGSHDAVAERLNVSRPTYFRHHRQAVERLAARVFG